MTATAKSPRREQYTVGWMCALKEERAAAVAMLDVKYEDTPTQDPFDTNDYAFGRVKNHNVVIASLPAGDCGKSPAATVANQMLRSFTSINIRLMVGIGGGVPTADFDIRLGDVVVSQPQDRFGGVVQYDRGKKTAGGKFERTDQLGKPPQRLLNALLSMQTEFEINDFDLGKYLHDNLQNQQRMLEKFGRPHEKDDLYQADYDHDGDGRECINCERRKRVPRDNRRSAKEVKFHYGTIASGNLVMKNGIERDKISQDLGGILCFEMEAAGLMDNFPCLVIRGICDYADSHKNKRWQRYAAITAAAYAKRLLSIIPGNEQPTGQQHNLPSDEFAPKFADLPAHQRPRPLGPWTPGSGQPAGQQYGPPFNEYSPEFAEMYPQQWSPSISQLNLELGQSFEHPRSLSSGQLPSGFLEPFDHYRSPSRNQQSATPSRGSPFNQSASGYKQSSIEYGVYPSNQLQQGIGRPSAYPSSTTDQRSFDGVSSKHPRPPPIPYRIGHSDSDLTRCQKVPEFAAHGVKENSHSQAPKPPAKDHGQKGYSKDGISSTKGGQKQSHREDPNPFSTHSKGKKSSGDLEPHSKHDKDQGHSKGAGSSRSPKPHSKQSKNPDHSNKAEASEKSPKVSAHAEDNASPLP